MRATGILTRADWALAVVALALVFGALVRGRHAAPASPPAAVVRGEASVGGHRTGTAATSSAVLTTVEATLLRAARLERPSPETIATAFGGTHWIATEPGPNAEPTEALCGVADVFHGVLLRHDRDGRRRLHVELRSRETIRRLARPWRFLNPGFITVHGSRLGIVSIARFAVPAGALGLSVCDHVGDGGLLIASWELALTEQPRTRR